MEEYSLEKYLGWILAGLVSIVAYFMRLAHKETKEAIKTIEDDATAMKSDLVRLDIKLSEQGNKTQMEIKLLREILEAKLTGIENLLKNK